MTGRVQGERSPPKQIGTNGCNDKTCCVWFDSHGGAPPGTTERGKTMRAVIYRANTKCGQRVSITCDFALGEEDIGENQAISNLIGTCLDKGLEIDLSTYKRQEVK